MLCYLALVYHASILPCQASNPPFLANHCLAKLPLLLSPSYSVVSCRWSSRLLHAGIGLCWDITISLILINASIYMVKGGRFGLMLGILFHSCRLTFRHTDVMFLDFAFLTRSGLWEPLDSSPCIKLLQQGPTLVFHLPNNQQSSLGVRGPKGHLYFNSPGQCFSKCWSELEPLAAPPRGNLRVGFSYT